MKHAFLELVKLRRHRRALGWSQGEVAKRAGIARVTVASAEQGWRTAKETAEKVATALGVDIRDLVQALDEKQCSRCFEVKSRSEFWRSGRAKDGLHWTCKPCVYADRNQRRAG